MKKEIKNLVVYLGKVSGYATSEEEALEKGLKGYINPSFASHYGGYRLEFVKIEEGKYGCTSGVFGENGMEGRMKAKEFEIYLNGLIKGIEFVKQAK